MAPLSISTLREQLGNSMLNHNTLAALVAVTDSAYQMRLTASRFAALEECENAHQVFSNMLEGSSRTHVLDRDFANFVCVLSEFDASLASRIFVVTLLRELLTAKGVRPAPVEVLVDVQTRASTSIHEENLILALQSPNPKRTMALVEPQFNVQRCDVAQIADDLIGGAATVIEALEILDVSLVDLMTECPVLMWATTLSKDHITALNRLGSHLSNLIDAGDLSKVTVRDISASYVVEAIDQHDHS